MPCSGTAPSFTTNADTGQVVAFEPTTCVVTITDTVTQGLYVSGYSIGLYRQYGKQPTFDIKERIQIKSIPSGSGTKVITFTDIPGDGLWYYRSQIECDGVGQGGGLRQSNADLVVVSNCDDIQPPPGDDPTIPLNAIPHDGIDELIWLVRPLKTVHGWTFLDKRVLSRTYQRIQWYYYRNGGCGGFRILLREAFLERDAVLDEGWEIHVRIKLSGETDYTTWYRGVVRSVERRYQGNEVLTELRGQGYLEQMAGINVNRRYPKGQRICDIVDDIVDNFIKPDTRIIRPRDVDPTNKDGGVDSSANYVLKGPVHFECSALKAIKFLAELQGDIEYGVSAERQFYFRQKRTVLGSGSDQNAFFVTKDLVDVLDGGKEVDKVNKISVESKQFGHRELLSSAQDVTDITQRGLFHRPIEVPWTEHDHDALRWAENIIARKKGANAWKSVSWSSVTKRIEKYHPDSALHLVRIYGKDVSHDFDDLDISKIMYTKGGNVRRNEVVEMNSPIVQKKNDDVVLRAIIYAGFHHHDLVEELEEKIVDQLEAVKSKHKQFRNPNVDVTHPDPSIYFRQPGQIFGLYKEGATDVTNTRLKLTYWDVTGGRWNDLIAQRTAEGLPATGDFVGEEYFVWDDATHNKGKKYYWAGPGNGWVAMDGRIDQDLNSSSSTGSASEETLRTVVIPTHVLNENGKGVRIRAWGTVAANANTKTLRLYFGNNLLVTNDITTAPNGVDWLLEATVYRVTSTTHRAVGEAMIGSTGQSITTTFPSANTTTGIPVTFRVVADGAGADVTIEGLATEAIN